MMPVALRDVVVTVLRAMPLPRQALLYLGRLAAAAMTAVGGLAIGPGIGGDCGHFTHAVVVAFMLLSPGFAIARLLPSMNTVLALIVGVTGAVAINALVAQSMLSASAWSPRAGVGAVGLIAALLWLVPASRPGATHRPTGEIHHPPPTRRDTE